MGTWKAATAGAALADELLSTLCNGARVTRYTRKVHWTPASTDLDPVRDVRSGVGGLRSGLHLSAATLTTDSGATWAGIRDAIPVKQGRANILRHKSPQ